MSCIFHTKGSKLPKELLRNVIRFLFSLLWLETRHYAGLSLEYLHYSSYFWFFHMLCSLRAALTLGRTGSVQKKYPLYNTCITLEISSCLRGSCSLPPASWFHLFHHPPWGGPLAPHCEVASMAWLGPAARNIGITIDITSDIIIDVTINIIIDIIIDIPFWAQRLTWTHLDSLHS